MSKLFTADTIGVFLEKTATKHPNHEFVVFPELGIRWSYDEFNERVDRLARGLLHVGIVPGDHIGIWADNIPDWLTFYFASAKIGAVLVLINTFFKRQDAEYVITDSDIKALILADRFRDVSYQNILSELIPEIPFTISGCLKSERFPKLRVFIHLGIEHQQGMYNIEEILWLGKKVSEPEYRRIVANVSCHDVVNIQYTSGTTGFPKGVMLTHNNILNNGYYVGECQHLTSKDRLCLPVPLFHCFGTSVGVLAALTHTTPLVILNRFDVLSVLKTIYDEKCTALYGVPSMFIAELNHPLFSKFDLNTLRTGVMSGAPCPIEIMNQVIKKMHIEDITIAYGLTEASPIFIQTRISDPLDKCIATVGKKHPHVEVKIIDSETGTELGTGKIGEVCCRGYNVMKGYYKNPEATSEVIDSDGWLHTGDLGEVDEMGYYKITGRLKDMIISGGENVDPREVEEFLFTVDGIKDTQVVGVPDEKWGEIVVAFVICQEGKMLSDSFLRSAMMNEVAGYKIPKHFFFVEKFPMTSSGKIQKLQLREMAMEMLGIDRDNSFIHSQSDQRYAHSKLFEK